MAARREGKWKGKGHGHHQYQHQPQQAWARRNDWGTKDEWDEVAEEEGIWTLKLPGATRGKTTKDDGWDWETGKRNTPAPSAAPKPQEDDYVYVSLIDRDPELRAIADKILGPKSERDAQRSNEWFEDVKTRCLRWKKDPPPWPLGPCPYQWTPNEKERICKRDNEKQDKENDNGKGEEEKKPEVVEFDTLFAAKASELPAPPFTAKFLGYESGGFLALEFMDKRTNTQFEHLQQGMRMYFNNVKVEDVRIDPADLQVGMLVFARWPKPEEDKYEWETQLQKDKKVLQPQEEEPVPSVAEKETTSPQKMVLDYYYARAKVIKISPEKRAVDCLNIDKREFVELGFDNVYVFPPALMDTPAKVQLCRIAGLEFWSVGNVLVELDSFLPTVKLDMNVLDIRMGKDKHPVVDVEVNLAPVGRHRSSPLREKCNLKDLISQSIEGYNRVSKEIIKGVLYENAFVANMNEEGDVFVSLHSAVQYRLTTIGPDPPRKKRTRETVENTAHLSDFEYAYEILGERDFLARWFDDMNFYRVKLLDYDENGKTAKVQYLEFGDIHFIPVDDMIPTVEVDIHLPIVKPQGIHARFNGINKILNIDGYFKLFPIDVEQKIMIAGFREEGGKKIPLIDCYAFKKNENGKKAIYVNEVIVEEGIAEADGVGIRRFQCSAAFISGLSVSSLNIQNPQLKNQLEIDARRSRYASYTRIDSVDRDENDPLAIPYLRNLRKYRKPAVPPSPDLHRIDEKDMERSD